MKKKIKSKLKNLFSPNYELSLCEEIIFWTIYSIGMVLMAILLVWDVIRS